MQDQDYLGIKYNQEIDGDTTECVSITVADLWGNILKQAQDPDFTYAAAIKIMGIDPNTSGLDPVAGMQSAILFHTLPASQETFTALSAGQLYAANFNNYTPDQKLAADNTRPPKAVKTLAGYQDIVNWLEQNQGGVGIPLHWYPSFMTPNADGTLPAPSGVPSNHMVVCYYADERGLKVKPYLGGEFGDNGYVYIPEALLLQIQQPYLYSYAFDPSGWRWYSVALIAVTHPWLIQYALPQMQAIGNAPDPNSPLLKFCTAIRDYEGGPGDANYRNNNPGNCRYNPSGYLAVYGKVRCSPDNFAIFPSWQQGWLYLQNLVKEKIANHPSWTFQDFFATYAPTSDGNDPTRYAAFVAKRCGVDITANVKTTLKL